MEIIIPAVTGNEQTGKHIVPAETVVATLFPGSSSLLLVVLVLVWVSSGPFPACTFSKVLYDSTSLLSTVVLLDGEDFDSLSETSIAPIFTDSDAEQLTGLRIGKSGSASVNLVALWV